MKSLSQIARELNVSSAAVSYVYNNKWRENRINEKLAYKIEQKIKEENAFPDTLGMQLRTGKTHTIGVILSDLERSYNLEMLAGIEKAIANTDNLILLGNSRHGVKEKDFINMMMIRRVDGLICCPFNISEINVSLNELEERNIPVVFIDNYLKDRDVPFVVTDNFAGASQAIRYCIDQGKKRIAYLGGRNGIQVLEDRYQGYCSAMRDAGLEVIDSIYQEAKGDSNSIRIAVKQLLETENPDAIFVGSFIYFSEGFEELNTREINVPDDLMLIGFDQVTNDISKKMDTISVHKIPFVRQQAETMGRIAVEQLLRLIDGKKSVEKRTFIDPQLSWE